MMTQATLSSKRTVYEYQNADGTPYCEVVRVDKPDGAKDLFTLPSGLPGPHPVYRAERLASLPAETPIHIVEGEKCVEALEAIGLTAITSKGGSSGAHKTDWQTVSRFNHVIVLPDADEPGAKYATTVIEMLAALPGPRRVDIVELPGLGEGEDVHDYIAMHGPEATTAAIEESARPATLATIATLAAPPENMNTRLVRDIPKAEAYPVDALGEMQHVVDLVADINQAPAALVAQSFLASAALAVQKHGNIVIDGRVSPTSLYCLSVAQTGDRKTAVDSVALYPHREWMDSEFIIYKDDMLQYDRETRAYKAALKHAERKKDRDAIEDAIEAVGNPPVKPLAPSLLIGNMTSEGLNKQLHEALPYAGVFSDEGGALIGGYAMSTENLLRTLSEFSTLWGISNELRVRAGQGMTSTRGKRLSMHLMTQPDVAALLFGKRIAHGQGFIPRLLVVWPETLRGTRTYRTGDLSQYVAVQRYNKRIQDALNTPTDYKDDRRDCLDPRAVPLSKEAMNLWVAFHDCVETQNAPDGPLDGISGWASKAAEHAARIAGVLALYDDLLCEEVSAEHMAAGIRLAEYYLAEMFRVHAQGEQEESILLAESLLTFMQAHHQEVDNVFKSAYLLQYGPNRIRDAAALQEVLSMLNIMGMAEPIPGRGRKWRLT